VACSVTTPAAAEGETVDFDFHDSRYVLSWQHHGGRAYVPAGVGDAAVPLVIFLHGTNTGAVLHSWMSERSNDLRPELDQLVERNAIVPAVLAAPSQTRRASIRHLWDGFDYGAFVHETQAALGERARIDRNRIVLVGHSGAGCNPEGGLLAAAAARKELPLFGLVAIDVCMKASYGFALGKSRARSVSVFWQVESWKRDYEDFYSAFLKSRSVPDAELDLFEEVGVPGRDAHNQIVPRAFALALTRLLAPKSADNS
jgi:poly(3-hydroxybutyrate) depolymerase